MLKDVLFKNRNKFNLQLFAEETPAETNTDPAGNGGKGESDDPTDPKPSDPRKVAKYSDADVDEMFNKRFARWQKEQEKKTSEAERLGRMTAEEKANERMKNLEDELAKYKKDNAIAAMTKTARGILQEENINIGDELLSTLVSDNADDTKAAVTSFIKLFKAEVEKAVKEAYKGETPKSGGSPAGLTRKQAEEKLKSITNPVERREFIQQNMDLLK